MKQQVIKSAINKLELMDIALHECHFFRNQEIDPDMKFPDFTYQGKLGIKTQGLVYTDQAEKEELNVFRCYVSFGVRAVHPDDAEKEEKESRIYYTIEADFRIDYHIKEDLTKEEISEFADFNVVHNAWPFWRQHVLNITHNANLPRLIIPFFSGQDLAKNTTKKKHMKG